MTYANKVSWTIEADRCAVLVHDMQPHYLAALPPRTADRITANVSAIAAACLARGVPVFASQVSPVRDLRERGLMRDMWGNGPVAGTHDLDLRLALAGDAVRPLVKRSYSAFYGNDFEVLLRRLGRDAILIVGVYTSIGCQVSAVDAFMRDIRAFMVADALADLSPADHASGLAAAAKTCARIVDSAEVVRAMRVPAGG